MDEPKQLGGKIGDWSINDWFPSHYPEQIQVLFGTLYEDDPLGRWPEGHHMRSSQIVKLDRDAMTCETANTIYTLVGPELEPMAPGMIRSIILE